MRINQVVENQINSKITRLHEINNRINQYERMVDEINVILKGINKNISDIDNYKKIIISEKKRDHPKFKGKVYDKQYLGILEKSGADCDKLHDFITDIKKRLTNKKTQYEREIRNYSMEKIRVNCDIDVLKASRYIMD